jgi:ferredoxin
MRLLRPLVQLGFVGLTVVGVFVVGGHAERWCPFGGVEAMYAIATGGNLPCSLAFTNLFVLGGVLLVTLLFRRAFCGYVCPVGAISELLGKAGACAKLGPRAVPRRVDTVLSLLKYPVLAIILWLTWRSAELIFRGFDPCYALISRHGEDITFWSYVVAGAIVVGSLFVTVPFCRWLCPLAAVLNPISKASPGRIVRDPDACLECAECAGACPMAIPVDEVETVGHARCTACLDCVDACPDREILGWRVVPGDGRRVARPVLAAAVLLLLAGAVVAGLTVSPPSFTWTRGELPADAKSVSLEIDDLTCRGRSSLLVYFVDRDDLFAVPGPLRLETWPGPERGRAVVTFDPAVTDADAIRAAVVEPYFDELLRDWRHSPFSIEGYDPLAFE